MTFVAVRRLAAPAILLGWTTAWTQDPEAVLPPVAAELVEVDVMVTDRQGRPVSGLTADDFILLEDGRPQRPAFFLAGEGGSSGARPEPAVAEGDAGTEALRGRYVVFAVDDLRLSAQSMVSAKAALKRSVTEQLSAEDEVAVVTCSGNLGLFQPFTRERAVLLRAIDRLRFQQRRPDAGGRASMTEYQAQAIERGDPQALELAVREIEQREALPLPDGVRNPRAETEAKGMARNLLSQSLASTGAIRDTLAEVLRGLGGLPGRKAVVLVSDGFLLGAGTAQGADATLRPLMHAATRSRVAIFALDSRGLFALPPGGDASEPAAPVQAMPGLRQRYEREASEALREGMRELAESTGGFLVQGTNDLFGAMGRILDSHAAAYVLAYTPPKSEGSGRFHRIEVKLKGHSALEVHARRGYFSTEPRQASVSQRDAGIHRALSSVAPLHGIPLRLAASFLDLPPNGLRIVIRAHVDLAGVAFESVAGRREADLELVSVVYGEDGGLAAEMEGQRADMRLAPANYERVVQEGLGYQRSVPIQPGVYQVRLVAREGRSDRLGSASLWIEVPDLGKGALALSDVVLYAEAGPSRDATSSGLKDVQALRRYARGANLYYMAYAYNPRRDDQGATEVVAQAQVWAGDQPQGVSPPQPLAFEGRTASVSGRIALEGLAAGAYELRLLVADRRAQALVQKRVAFTVE